MLSRRALLVASAAALVGLRTRPLWAAAAPEPSLKPNVPEDQSRAFQAALDRATAAGRPLVLAPGRYEIGGIRLPDGARIAGEPRFTRLRSSADRPVFTAERLRRAALVGLDIDGADRLMGNEPGVVVARAVEDLVIEDCAIGKSTRSALALEACGGRIEGNRLSTNFEFGIISRDAKGLAIRANTVVDCADGGILVHRSNPGDDGTIVAGNRIERIRARSGGTGQVGNGINIFKAGNVQITGNKITDCALSAIRSNTGSDVQIVGNHCRNSGEVAIYSEYEFQGALIADNLVDGATCGISVANFLQGGRLAVVQGNLIRNLTTVPPYEIKQPMFGIGIVVEADTTVTGNTIEGAPLFGMLLGWGPYLRDVTVTGNLIRDAGVGIAVSVVEGARDTLIAQNTIHGTKRGGIVGFRWHDMATGELGSPGADVPKHLTISGNRIAK